MRQAWRRVLPALAVCGFLTVTALAGLGSASAVAAAGSAAAPVLVRVGIGRALTTAVVGAGAPYALANQAGGATVLSSSQAGSVTVTADPAGVKVADKVYAGPLRLTATGGYVTYAGHSYRGYLEVLRTARGLLSVVNVVDVEEYLPGVVPREMSASWPAEALKAQAVAARTYALAQVQTHPYGQEGFDVTADTASQEYGGVEAEALASTAAVQATRGQVVVDAAGNLITAFFFSASGGMTEDDEYVWGGPGHSYLRGVADYDQLSPWYRWQVILPWDEVQKRLGSYGVDVGALQALQPYIPAGQPEVAYRSPATGQYKDYLAVGDKGQATISASRLRSALGLRSRVFTLTRLGGQAGPVTHKGTEVLTVQTAGGTASRGIAGSYALAAGGNPVLLGGGDVQVLGTGTTPPALQVDGRGYGHGIGMSQWGAQGMALLGMDYKAILTHYYTGTQVVQR